MKLFKAVATAIALCAGAVVTRVTTDDSADLGKDIASELVGSSRTLFVTGGVVATIGLVPGFPTVLFLLFGGGLAFLGYRLSRQQAEREAAAAEARTAEEARRGIGIGQNIEQGETMNPKGGERLVIRLGSTLHARLDPMAFVAARESVGVGASRRYLPVSQPPFNGLHTRMPKPCRSAVGSTAASACRAKIE